MQVHDLATRQRDAGLAAHVVTPTSAAMPGMQAPPDPDWVHRVGPDLTRQLNRTLSAAASAHRLMSPESFDVVHIHASVLSPFATAAAFAAIRARLPTVITMHSLWSGLGPLPKIADTSMRLHTWPVVWSSVSEKAAAPIRRALGDDSSVAVLPNGIDAAEWLVEPSLRNTGTVTVVSVMRFAWRKRPLPLLRIMRQVRSRVPSSIDVRLMLVGDGPLLPALQRYIRRHSMAEWVTLCGRLDRKEIRDIFASSDIYVAPAQLESFGIAALEARSAGLPVIASSRGGVDEFVTQGREGLLTVDDQNMADALAAMITTPGLRDAISAHNRAVVPSVGWPEVLYRASELYEQAADLRGRVDRERMLLGSGRKPAASGG